MPSTSARRQPQPMFSAAGLIHFPPADKQPLPAKLLEACPRNVFQFRRAKGVNFRLAGVVGQQEHCPGLLANLRDAPQLLAHLKEVRMVDVGQAHIRRVNRQDL